MNSLEPPPVDDGRAAAWRAAMTHSTELLVVLNERDPRRRDGVDLLLAQLERACLATRVGTPVERDVALRGAAAAGHAAAIAGTRTTGRVQMTHAGSSRSFPASGEVLPPGLWVAGWATSLVTRDLAARSALEQPAVMVTTSKAGDGFWASVLPALASVAQPESHALVGIDTAAARTAAAGARIVPPGYREHLVLPLLEVARQIAVGDRAALDVAVAVALRRHEEWYAAEERYFDPMGLLSLPVLGLVCRAADLGIGAGPGAGSLPADLVIGSLGQRETGEITYEYPPRRARSADEVTWFLDLEGFPRDRREHVVVRRGAALVAAYDVGGAPGLDHARLDVELVDAGLSPSEDDLVDVGDLLAAADLLSGRAGDDELPLPVRRSFLEEAADCIAAAIGMLEQVDRPGDAIHTPRGREVFLAEPGRVEVERLDALHAAWRAQICGWDVESVARQHRQSAVVSLTALRLHIEPILAALASDTTGEVAAHLRPVAADYGRVFTGDAADEAARLYAAYWDEPWRAQVPSDAQSRTQCHLAPAGMLGDDNELSRPFPLGYRQVAPLLRPSRVWATWKYVVPGSTSGLAFDGLVWCDDHWSWFPRPYRVLRWLVYRQ